MLCTVDAWHRCGDVAMMLKEVEMSPSALCEVVRLAEFAAVRAGELCATVCLDFQFKAMRIDACIKALFNNLPRRRYSKAKFEDV